MENSNLDWVGTKTIENETATKPVSIKHGLRTTNYGLGIKHGLGIKRGLGIKYGLRYKTRTEHYGLSIKHEERFYIE